MAYTTINKSTDYFNTKLYTGNGSSSHGITGINFKPDWTWIKSRSDATDHILTDIVRGATVGIKSNTTAGNATDSNQLKSFDTDGFTLGSENDVNGSSRTYASWNWKANGAGSANTDGSINSTVSVNTTAGFSIVKYTGNSTAGQTVGHGLGVTPKVVIIKRLNGAAQSWICKFPTATDGYLALNATDAISASSGWLPVSSSLITLANNWSAYNNNGNDYIAYCFAEKTGYSKFGSYTGNGSTDGNFLYLGFKPSFFLVKRITDGTEPWIMFDNKRSTSGFNGVDKNLKPSATEAEATQNPPSMDFLSNGVKFRNTDGTFNNSSKEFIYMAFAEAPLVGTNNVPCTAR